MFDIFFGWNKASKCKKLLKRGQCRLKLLKNKRSSIARLLRDDVAELILAGHQQTAFNRAEQLCNDLSLVSAYELLDQFCEFILVHLPYVRRHKDIPNDINEAVSSLIFASARCGDVPELRGIRKLFAERYGQRYATAAVELFPGNLVNHQIIEKLSGKAVPHDVKLKLFDEIARGCSLKRDLLALEFTSEVQKQEKDQVLDMYLLTYYNEVQGFRIQDSSAKDIEGAARSEDNKCSSKSCQTSRQNSGMTSISISSSIARQSSNDTSESQLYEKAEETELSVEAVRRHIGKIRATNSSSSSESSYHCPDENLIYLDDIEEFESPNAKDQRLFMFNSSSKKESQISGESRSMDMEYYIYDGELATQKRVTRHNRKNCSDKCSLEDPCYCSGDETHGFLQEDLCDNFSHGNNKAKALRMRHDHVAAVYDVFTYPDPKPDTVAREGSHDFGSNPRKTSFGTRKGMAEPPYRRVATMPQERARQSSGGNIGRSNSCPFKHLSHVHPKLPDYDDFSAKFMALKKDQHQNKVSDRETRLV